MAGNLIVNHYGVRYQLRATMNTADAPATKPAKPSITENWGVAVLLGAFLLVNLLTAVRFPFVWIDEVMYSDPAVNLLLGQGFTSSAWYAQAADEFWAGNVPLHAALLSLWLRVFGLSITAVRSVNYLYLVVACVLVWRASVRLNLVQTARARFVLLLLLIAGYSMVISYRGGRPDALAMLVAAVLFYLHSLDKPWARIGGFALLGLISPWAGLQLLPLLAVGGTLTVVFLGWRALPQIVGAWLGAAVGVGSLVAFLKAHHVWEAFLRSTGQHTKVGFLGLLFSGQFRHSNLLPKDFSFWPVLALALGLLLWLLVQRRFRWRSPLGFGLAWTVGISVALVVGGKFPTYYGWMTYGPLCVCICATLSTTALPAAWRWASAGLLAAAILIGAGLLTAVAAYDWPDRNYEHIRSLVRQHVTQSDWLYGDHAVYYAAKPLAQRVFMPYYLPAMSDTEKSGITVLVIAPYNLAEVTNVIGGRWVSTGARYSPRREGLFGTRWKYGILSMPNYELEVFRRAERKP